MLPQNGEGASHIPLLFALPCFFLPLWILCTETGGPPALLGVLPLGQAMVCFWET